MLHEGTRVVKMSWILFLSAAICVLAAIGQRGKRVCIAYLLTIALLLAMAGVLSEAFKVD